MPGPDEHVRTIPGWTEPAREEEYEVWIDGNGQQVDGPREPESSRVDPATGELTSDSIEVDLRDKARRQVTRMRLIPEKRGTVGPERGR